MLRLIDGEVQTLKNKYNLEHNMAKEVPSYYSFLNTNLLAHLPKDLGLVLDIGCGTGELGANYKKDNKTSVWHGIETYSDALNLAKKNLDQAWKIDGNDFAPNATMKKKKYDALVYSLSLEQLANPLESLQSHLSVLKKSGQLFFCITNVQHWTLLRHLISGNWEFSEKGILHKDNQHFFTRKSFMRLLDSAGLKMTTMNRYSYENDPIFINRRGARLKTIEKLREFCQDTQLYFNENDFRTYHYVIAATRK